MATPPPGYRPPDPADLYLLPCLPYDTTGLPAVSSTGAPLRKPVASDTLGNCRDCGRAIWIGDRQQHLLAQVGPDRARVICYFCWAARPDLDDVPFHGLGPDNPDAYR